MRLAIAISKSQDQKKSFVETRQPNQMFDDIAIQFWKYRCEMPGF
jgi:hypothetical protein